MLKAPMYIGAPPHSSVNDAPTLRRNAEERWRVSVSPLTTFANSQTAHDSAYLLHELQVHQIELEMQHEQLETQHERLTRSYEALKETRSRYSDLYDLAPVGYCTISDAGLIWEANLTAATLLGVPRSQIKNQILYRFIARDDQDIFYLMRQRCLASDSVQTCELRLAKNDGTLFWAQLQIARFEKKGEAATLLLTFSDIAARRKAEDSVHASQHDLRSVLDNMPSMIGYWDRNLLNRFGNQAYADWFGVDPAKMVGKHIREVIGEERYQLNLPYLEAALRGERQQFERAIPTPDGTQIRHSLAEYIPDIVDGEVLGFFAQVSDVTSIRRTDYALREAQRLGGIGNFCLDIASDRWTSSEVFDDIFGIDAFYARTIEGWAQRLHPGESEKMLGHWQKSLANKSSFDHEFRVVRASDGAIRWVHELGNFVCDEQGGPVQFIGSVQDITERKLKDERLVQKLEAIRLREQALSQITQGVIITGTDRLTTYVNDGFSRITGYCLEEMLGQSCNFLQGPDSQPEVVLQMRAALDAKQPFQGEILNYRKDGTTFWNELSINPVFDQGGNLTQFVGVVRDITQKKQAVLDLAKAKEAAEAANIAKSAFLSTISHELRTPMNGVLGMAQILMMPGITEDKRINFAGVIADSGKGLMALIDDILDVSHLDVGNFQLKSDVLDAAQLLLDAKASFSEQVGNKNLTFDCDWTGSTARYLGDSRRLKQMLSNLINNAIKFTTQGGIRVQVRELECNQQNGLLEFSVTDTGVGIAQEKLYLLFQPFSQVDSTSTRTHGGAGMGLSIVRKLAERMGGEVGVESNVGQGSRFWFRVRLERSQ